MRNFYCSITGAEKYIFYFFNKYKNSSLFGIMYNLVRIGLIVEFLVIFYKILLCDETISTGKNIIKYLYIFLYKYILCHQ